MADHEVVVFSDFSGGEFGRLGAVKAPPGSFTGQNVVVYDDGSVGPRAGLKQYTLTGVASSLLQVLGTWLQGDIWFQAANNHFYSFDGLNMASQAVSDKGDASYQAEQSVVVGDDLYMSSTSGGIRIVDDAGAGVTAIAGSPNAWCLASYGDRLVAGGGVTPFNRLRYSAAATPTSWPAGNFIDVGESINEYICALIPLRTGLVIATQRSKGDVLSGQGYRWWLLTGVPGVNDTLREIVRAQGPAGTRANPVVAPWRSATVLSSGVIAFVGGLSLTPCVFNGSDVRVLRHLFSGDKLNTPTTGIARLRDEDDVLTLVNPIGARDQSYLRRNNIWTLHTFESELGLDQLENYCVFVPSFIQDLVVFGTRNNPPTFYAWTPYLDHPPLAADTFSTTVTASECFFTLPDWFAPLGEVAVRNVVVHFRDYSRSGGTTNSLSVVVTPLRVYEADEGATQTFNYTRANPLVSGAYREQRRQFNCTEEWGRGFRVKLSNLAGVAVQRIEVSVDRAPLRGV